MGAGFMWLIVPGSLVALVAIASQELRQPTTLGAATRKTFKGFSMFVMSGGAAIALIYLAISNVMTNAEIRVTDAAEFATGMTQALERVAYLRSGEAVTFREWSGGSLDGSRYVLLRDDAGAVVRVENLSRDACLAALNYLSPYAVTVLRMRDERGEVHVGSRSRTCPEGEGRLRAVFRAPA
jgi:hypothetical protein